MIVGGILGTVLGAEIGTAYDGCTFYVRVEATPLVAAFIGAADLNAIYEEPERPGAKGWFMIPYTGEMDRRLMEIVDIAAGLRERHPRFGQVRLPW